jgi:hypothetical protein
VTVDAFGNAYISGNTYGSLGGPNAGNDDAFLAKYDSSGNMLWSQQIGTSDSDQSYSVAVDISGNAYISGRTYGSLGGANAGNSDAFLIKYAPVPEPSALVLLALAAAGFLVWRRSARR